MLLNATCEPDIFVFQCYQVINHKRKSLGTVLNNLGLNKEKQNVAGFEPATSD